MVKKRTTAEIPPPTCGVCAFAHPKEDALVCYANPPALLPDENGDITAHRGAEVFPQDPICRDFKPRMHS